MNSINHQANKELDDLPSKQGAAAFQKYIQCLPMVSDVGKAPHHKKAKPPFMQSTFLMKEKLVRLHFQTKYDSKTNPTLES